MNATQQLTPTPDPVKPPPIVPNTLDGAYIINGVIQTQLPHIPVNASLLATTGSSAQYYFNAIR